jgi:hypothetical protein
MRILTPPHHHPIQILQDPHHHQHSQPPVKAQDLQNNISNFRHSMGFNSSPYPNTATKPTSHNDSFSPCEYTEPMGNPGYSSPLSQIPQQSPAYQHSEVQSPYSNPHTSPQYISPQYVSQSPRTNIGSPQDRTIQYNNTRPPNNYSQFDLSATDSNSTRKFGSKPATAAAKSSPSNTCSATTETSPCPGQ